MDWYGVRRSRLTSWSDLANACSVRSTWLHVLRTVHYILLSTSKVHIRKHLDVRSLFLFSFQKKKKRLWEKVRWTHTQIKKCITGRWHGFMSAGGWVGLNRYLRLYSKRLGPVQVKPTRPPCGCLGNVMYLYGVRNIKCRIYIWKLYLSAWESYKWICIQYSCWNTRHSNLVSGWFGPGYGGQRVISHTKEYGWSLGGCLSINYAYTIFERV